MAHRFSLRQTAPLLLGLLLLGCSNESPSPDVAPGGAQAATGGTTGHGGTLSEGGSNAQGASEGDDAPGNAAEGGGSTEGGHSTGNEGGGSAEGGRSPEGGDTGNGGSTPGEGEGGTSGSTDDDPDNEAGTGNGAANAPYANVTAVSATGSSGSYTFSVSVESADIDCTQYADFWEVLDTTGTLVYRRILEHSHTDANGTTDPDAPGNTFTRSGGPVAVTEDREVIVRAHMSNAGYNGVAMRGSVATGFVAAPDIGSDFAADVEDDPPQPGTCQF
nr:MAG: hypothetical protein DIU78_04785 [Pseudomonadota bacterium]